jgi:hypothetical protein
MDPSDDEVAIVLYSLGQQQQMELLNDQNNDDDDHNENDENENENENENDDGDDNVSNTSDTLIPVTIDATNLHQQLLRQQQQSSSLGLMQASSFVVVGATIFMSFIVILAEIEGLCDEMSWAVHEALHPTNAFHIPLYHTIHSSTKWMRKKKKKQQHHHHTMPDPVVRYETFWDYAA